MGYSIALCTFNGERFLQEQLDSIASQTVLPFELIICDDDSSDNTPQIIKNFAQSANFPVHLYFNQENLGYVKNFEKAISLCKGDIVALCDQDDRWHHNKLEIIEKYFSDSKIGMVCSNAEIIDQSGQKTGESLWQKVGIDDYWLARLQSSKSYQALYERPLISGCTMAFRTSLWPMISPLPLNTYLIHDGWIALWASFFSNIKVLSSALMEYRLHDCQASGFSGKTTFISTNLKSVAHHHKRDQYQRHLNQLLLIEERLGQWQEHISAEPKQYLLARIPDEQRHLMKRLSNTPQLPIPKRCLGVLKELYSGRYHRYSKGFKSAMADLFYGV